MTSSNLLGADFGLGLECTIEFYSPKRLGLLLQESHATTSSPNTTQSPLKTLL